MKILMGQCAPMRANSELPYLENISLDWQNFKSMLLQEQSCDVSVFIHMPLKSYCYIQIVDCITVYANSLLSSGNTD
jgi:hypothetical protein